MSAKPVTSPRSLAEINKQIIEIKKKIQLSEGQRKASFEEYETERKYNTEQIQKLKKAIGDSTIQLHLNNDENAAKRIRSLRLEAVVGPLVNKTAVQIQETLDLQMIDQTKGLDLVRHRIKKRESYLTKLANEYQILLSDNSRNYAAVKIENPFKKKICALQNNIHRVEVQWREAEHVRKSYRTIRGSLLGDSGRFESTLKQLEERHQVQQRDIQHLQKINSEAVKTRANARGTLEREERTAMNSGKIREKQNAEYTDMVAERKLELERLERRIFQSGKVTAPRPDTADDTEQTEDVTTEEDHEVALNVAFNKLKDATGATSTGEVLHRFRAQKDTKTRLEYLKKSTEAEKRQLELQQDKYIAELERYKFAQERDKEKHSEDILGLKQDIEHQQVRKEKFETDSEEQESLLATLCKILYSLYLGLKEIGNVPLNEITENSDTAAKLVETLCTELEGVVVRSEAVKEDEEALSKPQIEELLPDDDDLMPPSYNALLRRTPLPVQGHPVHMVAPPVVSEDEEEVPSRGFLKRQAQLVVDAKSRRKGNVRIPIRK